MTVGASATFGKYRVTAHLGGGVQGDAYRVVCQDTGRLHTLKVFTGPLDEGVASAAWQAARLQAVAGTRGVPRAHEVFVTADHAQQRACLVTDYSRGRTLAAMLDEHPRGALSTRFALRVTHAVARVVRDLHASHGYHGDIHTENVVVARHGASVRLIDFYARTEPLAEVQREDIYETVALLYSCIGGRAGYARASQRVRWLFGGMRRDVVHRRHPSADALVSALARCQ